MDQWAFFDEFKAGTVREEAGLDRLMLALTGSM